MSNEQLFFGLAQVLRKFPKESGKRVEESRGKFCLNTVNLSIHIMNEWNCVCAHADRVLCHFCFKPKKITNKVVGVDCARKSQVLVSSIILLKNALDALPLLSKVKITLHRCRCQALFSFQHIDKFYSAQNMIQSINVS